MFKKLLAFLIISHSAFLVYAQEITLLRSGKAVSLRGLCVVSEMIIWVSGSAGSVGLSTDGGHHWKWMQVPHYEKSDFRDIEAFNDKEAVIMGITEPAVILRTKDGGNSWKTVFEDSSTSVFLDAMDFSGNQGAVVGDPDKGKIFFAKSEDRGKNWEKMDPSGFDAVAGGEAFFASSGSNLSLFPIINFGVYYIYILVSGGNKSCLYMSGKHYPLKMNQGKESTGANSIAINPADPNQAFIVGGDFLKDTVCYGNSLRIQLNPFVQTAPISPPHGYRSCVEYIDGKRMICCGTSGVDISTDKGIHWKLISDKSFHVCRRSKLGEYVFLAGPNGAIAKLKF
jgi:hypothetical protein